MILSEKPISIRTNLNSSENDFKKVGSIIILKENVKNNQSIKEEF